MLEQGQPVEPRRNSFDALRLAAALTVIAGHAVPLTGRGDPPTVGGMPFFDIAVYVFFSISGFLIAASWRGAPRARRYLRHRVARIFPALWIVVAVTVLVIGPLASPLGPSEYFARGETWSYLSNLVLITAYRLPGVFEGNPIGTVNGSLWTLAPEFTCYLVVLVVGLFLARFATSRHVRIGTYVTIGVVMAVVALASGDDHSPLPAMVFFMVGAAISECRVRRLPLWPALALLATWLGIGAAQPVAGLVAAWVAIPYTVVALGTRNLPVLRTAGRPGDASYGIYLWGFPVQQLTWAMAPDAPVLFHVLVVSVACYAIGLASWHGIEKRAMSWARRAEMNVR